MKGLRDRNTQKQTSACDHNSSGTTSVPARELQGLQQHLFLGGFGGETEMATVNMDRRKCSVPGLHMPSYGLVSCET